MFNKTILITDADGTLLTDDKRVLGVDKAAIAELIEKGGLFTVATGRGVKAAQSVVEEIGLDLLHLPLVVFNGAAIYDFNREKFLWKCELGKEAMEFSEKLLERFPEVAVEILVDDEVYVIRTNEFEEMHLDFAGIEPIRCSYDEVPKTGWIKVLLIDVPDKIDEVIRFCEGFCVGGGIPPVHMVRSSSMYYEILPAGINKWTGIEKLLEMSNLVGSRIVAAGDYMNDLEMIRYSDLGVATANAEDIVKAAADVVLCDNNSGIVRDIVKYLKFSWK
ncbi:MAG: HAD family hydrolase [Oscillospiraceae bacterium]|nr:HAD family hydrolase [Oscillospiraceae bacterium]